MNQEFTIRKASIEDAELVLEFIKAIADYEKMSDEVIATKETLEEFVFTKKAADVFIGECDGVPCGFALFFENFSTFIGRTGIHLEDLFVYPEYRGRGYGKKLFKAVAKEAVDRGCQRLEWVCLDWNKPSIDFYLSLGATPMSEWTTYRLAGEDIEKVLGK